MANETGSSGAVTATLKDGLDGAALEPESSGAEAGFLVCGKINGQ